MYRFWRRILSFMLTIFLANMMAWSYSSAALADWITEGKSEMSAITADANSVDPHQQEQQNCNHGCHAANHLQGQTSSTIVIFAPELGRQVFLNETFFLPPGIAQRQFRPPRLLTQA